MNGQRLRKARLRAAHKSQPGSKHGKRCTYVRDGIPNRNLRYGPCDLNVPLAYRWRNSPSGLDSTRAYAMSFSAPLAPLELTSTPIPVPDRMAVKPNPWPMASRQASIWPSWDISLPRRQDDHQRGERSQSERHRRRYIGVQRAQSCPVGGRRRRRRRPQSRRSIKGKLPKLEKDPITPPQVPVLDKPKLAIESPSMYSRTSNCPTTHCFQYRRQELA